MAPISCPLVDTSSFVSLVIHLSVSFALFVIPATIPFYHLPSWTFRPKVELYLLGPSAPKVELSSVGHAPGHFLAAAPYLAALAHGGGWPSSTRSL